MDAVRMFWLGDGALPIFPFRGTLHYMGGGYEGQEHKPLTWMPAAFNRQSGNAIIPIQDTTLEEFLSFMAQNQDVEGETLYVAIRTFARLETHSIVRDDDDGIPERGFINTLLAAVAIIPGIIEGAVPCEWRFQPLDSLVKLCTISEQEAEPEEPFLRDAWHQLAASRAQAREYRLVQGRAQKLLEAHLDEEQLVEFKKKHRFRVTGADGLVYLITYGSHGNVWQIETIASGKTIPRMNYCIVPTEVVPVYDQMLAQKLLIEANLDEFKRVANSTTFDDEGHPVDRSGAEEAPENPQDVVAEGAAVDV